MNLMTIKKCSVFRFHQPYFRNVIPNELLILIYLTLYERLL